MSENSERKISLKLLRLAGLCGIFGSVLPLIMVVAATVLSSWFRWDTNALSELGLGEESGLFNSAVLLGGVLNFLFALGLRQYLNGEKLVKTGAASVIMSSVCLALVGIFTIDYHLMHGVAALGYFVLAPVGFLMVGFGTKESASKKAQRCMWNNSVTGNSGSANHSSCFAGQSWLCRSRISRSLGHFCLDSFHVSKANCTQRLKKHACVGNL